MKQRTIVTALPCSMLPCTTATFAAVLLLPLLSSRTVSAESTRFVPAGIETYADDIKVSVWAQCQSEAKRFIEDRVRDPQAVKYNKWERTSNNNFISVNVDFTATNGFGGPERVEWKFVFERGSYKMKAVLDITNKRVLFDEMK